MPVRSLGIEGAFVKFQNYPCLNYSLQDSLRLLLWIFALKSRE